MTEAAWKRWKAVVPGLVIASCAVAISAPAVAAPGTSKTSVHKSTRIKAVIPAGGSAGARVSSRASARVNSARLNGSGVHRAVLVHSGRVARGVNLRKVYAVIPARPSIAEAQGLRFGPGTPLGDFEDSLAVKSSVALVMEEGTHDVLFSRNTKVALPIASITKLMTSLVVLDSNEAMDELITVTTDDLDTEKFSRSRLAVGTTLSRRDMLHLALMSSENRAAHALGRNYAGGLGAFVAAMNAKARSLGMLSAHFNDPTGLSSQNVASAEDLVKLVNAASANPTIRAFSTDHDYAVPVGKRMLEFHNTNSLVASPAWDIVVQKTGYITEAGKCLVMKAVIEGRSVVIVLLDSFGKYTRLGDANRIRQWMESHSSDPLARIVKKTS